jgi:hypothetical protein
LVTPEPANIAKFTAEPRFTLAGLAALAIVARDAPTNAIAANDAKIIFFEWKTFE